MGQIADTAAEQKRQVLAAGAEAGKAGVAALDAANQAIDQQRAAALQQAHSIAQTVGVTAEQQGAMDAFSQLPLDRAKTSLAGARSIFDLVSRSRDQANSDYFDKIAAIEPVIEARAAAAAGGGGGGGGGRGGGGGGDSGLGDLTDAQLGKFLMNQAVAGRQEGMNAALDRRDTLTGQRQQVGKARKQAKKQLKGMGRLGKVAIRQGPQAIQKKQQKAQRRLDALRGPNVVGLTPEGRDKKHDLKVKLKRLDRVAEAARSLQTGRKMSKALTGQIGQADTLYRSLMPTGGYGRPLSQDALELADQYGVDPILAQSLVGPTVDAQYGRALAYAQKEQFPNVYADASALKMRPVDVQAMVGSRAWRGIDDLAVQGLASGGTQEDWEVFARALVGNPSATGLDPKTVKQLKMMTHDQRLAFANLALHRYSPMFPTINDVQNQQEYASGY